MKTIMLLIIASMAISCGKQGNSSKSPAENGRRSAEEWMDTSVAGETELLNITMNESVILTESSIVFQRSFSAAENGIKIRCSFNVSSGTTWKINKTSSGLQLEFPDGHKQSLRPATDTRNNTSWVWSGLEDGIKMIRRYTFLPNRLVMNQDCEG